MDLVISPLKIELAGFLKRFYAVKAFRKNKLEVYKLPQKGGKVLVAITGMGKDNSLNSLGELYRYVNDLDIGDKEGLRIIATGFCGSLSDRIRAGDLVVYKKIFNLSERHVNKDYKNTEKGLFLDDSKDHGLTFRKVKNALQDVTAATVPQVIGKVEKKRILQKTFGCDVIDMESYWILKSTPKGSEITFIRAASDDTEEDFPEGRFIALKTVFSFFDKGSKCKPKKILRNIKKAQASITGLLADVLDL
jgi:nucleoside phosphorylase